MVKWKRAESSTTLLNLLKLEKFKARASAEAKKHRVNLLESYGEKKYIFKCKKGKFEAFSS
jgi:hypothetical protein